MFDHCWWGMKHGCHVFVIWSRHGISLGDMGHDLVEVCVATHLGDVFAVMSMFRNRRLIVVVPLPLFCNDRAASSSPWK